MFSLRQMVLRWWRPESSQRLAPGFTREQLLFMCLLVIGVNALTFYVLPQSDYDHRANLLAAAVLLAMLPFALSRRLHVLLVNMALVVAISLIVYIATETGGINSSALVFLTVLSVPALFFLGPRGAGVWMGLLFAVYLWLLMANLHGDMVRPPPNSGTLLWALSNHVFAAASLVLVLRLYDRLHHTQLAVVQERNRELEATQTHLMEAQAHKDEFVAAVGHELRTPMNAILGLNGVLREEFADDPVNAETAEHIRRSTEHLLHVVNDILDFAQLQAGRVSFFPEACALAPWLESMVQPFKARAQAKGLAWQLRLAPGLPPEIFIDRQRLGQLLGYLLDNAIKFTASGKLSLSLSQQGESLRVEVQDTGRGVAPERQQQIFNRFESADVATHQAFGGTGLGLSICERLVALQGGRIGVHSAVGQGAMFWFELPLHAAARPVETTQPRAVLARDAVFEVLVVDDNAMNLMVAQLQLRKAWPQVSIITASSGPEALALMQAQHFDVALIDMVMPEMDGLAVTRALRQLPLPLRNLPVVALTANTNPVDRQRCLDAGMNQVLYKPMDPDLMVRIVSDVLAEQEASA
jgi:signal transduction histidine kinase/ActR/RegA family two-component response regulator